jgi:hypothetical protein
MPFCGILRTLRDMADRHFRERGVVLVLCEGEAAKRAHQELFSFSDAPYRIIEGSITDGVNAFDTFSSGELHIVAGWETILCAAMWSRRKPAVCDVLALLEKAGMSGEDHCLSGDRSLSDIFSLLCRGERLDLLRRICRTAKASVESRCNGDVGVHCHLVSDETGRIVASSL